MATRFVADVLDEQGTMFDGQVVTIVREAEPQPPVEWSMPKTYLVSTEDGTEFVAFADELIQED